MSTPDPLTFSSTPRAVEAWCDRIEREIQERAEASRVRARLLRVGFLVTDLLHELEALDLAAVPEDRRAGLKAAMVKLFVLTGAKAEALLQLTLASTPAPAGEASLHSLTFPEAPTSAVSPRGAGQP